MKKLFLTSAALAALTGVAAAADLPPRMATKAAPYAAAYDWSGVYAGVVAGGGWGKSKWTDIATGTSSGDINMSGGLVGATAGFNVQSGALVWGAEADMAWAGIKGRTTNANCTGFCETGASAFGTLRGRLGVASDRLLAYATAGLAVARIKAQEQGTSASAYKAGWTAGAGLEYALGGAWSVKGEYLYAGLGKVTCGTGCSQADPFTVSFNAHLLRAGINYRF